MCDFDQTRLPEGVQLSVAVGSVHDTAAVHWPVVVVRVMSAGQPVMTGFWVSFTVTVKLQVELPLPEASVATYVTVVVPTGNVEPGVCDFVQVMLPDAVQLSVAVGSVQVTAALHRLLSFAWVMLAGQSESTGASVSVMVTVKLQEAVFPEASVTRKVLVVTPTGKLDPLASPVICVVEAPEQTSVPTGAV